MPTRIFTGRTEEEALRAMRRWYKPYHYVELVRYDNDRHQLKVIFKVNGPVCSRYYDACLTYWHSALVCAVTCCVVVIFGPIYAVEITPVVGCLLVLGGWFYIASRRGFRAVPSGLSFRALAAALRADSSAEALPDTSDPQDGEPPNVGPAALNDASCDCDDPVSAFERRGWVAHGEGKVSEVLRSEQQKPQFLDSKFWMM